MRVSEQGTEKRLYRQFPDLVREHSKPVNFDRPHVHFVPVTDRYTRRAFDATLDLIHYAKSCQRVGRCLRLCVYERDVWVGGIVLGSTFPNIEARDGALGLKTLVCQTRSKGIPHPWHRDNDLYWNTLQFVVNHARTFIFPTFQGRGLGIAAHRELLRTGLTHWKRRYQTEVAALDTLCTHQDSALFLRNGWRLVGQTAGYTSDPAEIFSHRVFTQDWENIRNNVALKRISARSSRWWVWVTVTDRGLLGDLVRGAEYSARPLNAPGVRRALRLG